MIALAGLAALFLLTALAYAMVGFGGGSTYTALLVLADTDYRILPAISLACNITVVTGSVIQYGSAGLIRWKRILPLAAVSVPMAFLGGLMEIPERAFITILGLSLLASAAALVIRKPATAGPHKTLPAWSGPALGGGIGFLAGLVGIGGGIFLAPILHLLRWGKAREIAAAASVFILVNSIAGLTGQVQRLSGTGDIGAIIDYWPLLPAVLIGGQIGVWLGRTRTSDIWLIRLTALLVLFVAARLLWRASGL
ncbi:sulfite exporter TauE/SafE family protein [Hyphobacterium sp. CCMP332]|uniref:sulfite exporter TauE/SafE family protein n=1 Tax=Hyphobacterium sp. CCMP332 TaxID=2749086 RepID=UPI001650A709|nr:sulfite exporter TauE/SafE family protein [Hyphobacterium sp. CCMP332]QNL19650.1 sulfite exporter TauE/SafE family protein [Hyphobacterium sp. CCMP332]